MPTATKPTRKSPFIYYISDVFAKRKADGIKNEGVQSAQFAEVVNGWKKLSEAEQQPYVEKAQREAAEYPAKLAAWEASLTEQDRDRIAKYNRHMRKQKRLAFEEQKATGATAPRPKSPFIRFALQRYNDGKASGEAKSYTETLKAAGEEWRNMSDADKEVSCRIDDTSSWTCLTDPAPFNECFVFLLAGPALEQACSSGNGGVDAKVWLEVSDCVIATDQGAEERGCGRGSD